MKLSCPIHLRVEADLPAAIAAAADKHRTQPAEWMRQKIREALKAEGIELPPLRRDDDDSPSPFRPDRGQRIAA